MDYQFVELSPADIGPVHEILIKCGYDLKVRFGLAHWDLPYPIQSMKRDASERSVYAVLDNEHIIATFTISTQPLEYYDKELWKYPEQQAMYVSHLAVLPELQSRGIGSWCMKIIENIAVDSDCAAIRLDAYEKYEQLLEFYRRLGYERRTMVKFQNLKLVCLEKIL